MLDRRRSAEDELSVVLALAPGLLLDLLVVDVGVDASDAAAFFLGILGGASFAVVWDISFGVTSASPFLEEAMLGPALPLPPLGSSGKEY